MKFNAMMDKPRHPLTEFIAKRCSDGSQVLQALRGHSIRDVFTTTLIILYLFTSEGGEPGTPLHVEWTEAENRAWEWIRPKAVPHYLKPGKWAGDGRLSRWTFFSPVQIPQVIFAFQSE